MSLEEGQIALLRELARAVPEGTHELMEIIPVDYRAYFPAPQMLGRAVKKLVLAGQIPGMSLHRKNPAGDNHWQYYFG